MWRGSAQARAQFGYHSPVLRRGPRRASVEATHE
jgi:hypothetical protein